MLTRTIGSRALIFVLTFVVALAAQGFTLAGKTAAGDDFIHEGMTEREKVVEMSSTLAEIQLPNGDQVGFIGLSDARGKVHGVVVMDVVSPDRFRLGDSERLEDLNPRELFAALSEPGTMMPKALMDLYENRSGRLGQGWARDLVGDTGTKAPLPCSPADTGQVTQWSNELADYADDFNHDNPFKSLYDGPVEMPNHWKKLPGDGLGNAGLYELNGRAQNVTAFYGSVIYCSEDPYNAATYNGQYIGNYVGFSYRIAGHATWYTAQSSIQLDEVGKIVDYAYFPSNAFEVSAPAYDFHLKLTQAKPYDQFHIGATWVKSIKNITIGYDG